ncbi:MAG: response regulator [Verrucomicrobia bacterium]|nr:response regulator [Verrucomicrobiota bacterium]
MNRGLGFGVPASAGGTFDQSVAPKLRQPRRLKAGLHTSRSKESLRGRLIGLLVLACFLSGRLGTAQAADNAAPVHEVNGSFVREWLVLGPVPSKDMEIDFLAEAGGEANVRPKEGDSITTRDGTRLSWTRLRSRHDLVNLEQVFGIQDWSVAYAYCELNCGQPIESDLRAHGYPAPLWLNGKKVGQTPLFNSERKHIPPVLPIKLVAGRNSCLIKLKHEGVEWTFRFQPLPPERAWAELHVAGRDRRDVAGALLQFFDKGELVGRVTTDASGKAEACLYPVAEAYDLQVTSGEMGTWLHDVVFPRGQRRRLDVVLTNAVSISGRVFAMDRSPQSAIVVQAIRVSDPSNSGRADLPVRQEIGAEQQLSPTADSAVGTSRRDVSARAVAGGTGPGEPPSAELPVAPLNAARTVQRAVPTNDVRIQSLLPMPAFSGTAHTDTNGVFRFVNLRPGKYRLRCHGPDGYVYPESLQELDASEPIVVESGRTREGIHFAFPEAKKGVWTSYPIRKGLIDLNPRSVHRTPDGMLWIGTDEATLHAHDGVEFETFSSPGNHAYVIDHDAGGTLWIGSSAGISRKVGGRIQTLSFSDTLPRKNVTAIESDRDGTVWFGTDSGLCKYDGRNLVTFTVKDGLPSHQISSLLRTRDGTLWMGNLNGLARFDGRSFSEPVSFSGLSHPEIGKLHQARDDALWYCGAYWDQGAYRFDGRILLRAGEEEGLLSDEVFDIAESSDGALWFATSKGLSKFNGTTIVNYTAEDGLGDGPVRDIFVDADDVLWCARGNQVSRFDPERFAGMAKRDGLIKNDGATAAVFDLEPDADGGFWIGTEWGGVYRTDGKKLHSVPSSPERHYVRQVHRGADGTFWFGTRAGIFKHEDGNLVRVLEQNWIIALCSDDEGNLWYGHGWNGGSLSRYHPKTGETATFTTAQGLPDDHVWSIERGADGALWVGTSAGLARYQAGKLEDFSEKLGIRTGGVFHIRRDAEGAIWVHSSRGLHRLKGNDRVSIAATNGLPDQAIKCSVRTRDGIIWMGTESHGLLGYDGKAVTLLDKRDGLLGNQPFAMATNTDDSLWVGFLDGGLTRYRPSKSPPSVRLLEVQLDNQTLTDFSNLPNTEIGNHVTVRYQEIDLKTHPEKRQFWYRLATVSGQTVFAGVTKDRRFEWTPRKGGAYTFEVQAIDRDLNYSAPARFTLRATVPSYLNAWIILSGGGTFVGLFVWAFIARALFMSKRREAVLLREQLLDQESKAREALERKNRQLDEARQAAEEANRAKSAFLANMSHEIRTPLNAILGFSDLLNGVAKDPKERSYVAAISSSGKSLLTIINDILDLSKIEAGRLELQYEPVSVRQLLTEVAQVFAQKIEEKGLKLEINSAKELPDGLLLDEVRLRQILFNVIGNAVKFTEKGTIRISAASKAWEADESQVDLLLHVADSGIGIPAGELDRIFDTFTQVSGQSTRKYGGTGLGLAITKRLTEMMGGTLRVESEVGVGSTFHFEFRGVAIAAAASPAIQSDAPSRGLGQFQASTILVAEDHPLNRRLLAAYFEGTGHQLLMAANGREAVEQARKERPDLIFMDIRMPEMDGWEAAKILKNDAELKSVPIIIITASPLADQDSRTKGLCDAFLRKPVSKSDLVEVVAPFLPRMPSLPEPAAAPIQTETDSAPLPKQERISSPELMALLEGQLKEVWPGLCERPNIAQIEKFALRLAGWAETYQSEELRRFAENLHQQAEQFDMDRLPKTLQEFPDLARSLALACQSS